MFASSQHESSVFRRRSIDSFSISFINISWVSWGLLVSAFLDSGNNLVLFRMDSKGLLVLSRDCWLGIKANPSPELTRTLFRWRITAGMLLGFQILLLFSVF